MVGLESERGIRSATVRRGPRGITDRVLLQRGVAREKTKWKVEEC